MPEHHPRRNEKTERIEEGIECFFAVYLVVILTIVGVRCVFDIINTIAIGIERYREHKKLMKYIEELKKQRDKEYKLFMEKLHEDR